jgi:hypothetical protein
MVSEAEQNDAAVRNALCGCSFSSPLHSRWLVRAREDSFRSLYYRLRLPPTSPSNLDHFYTVHRWPFAFTVLFIGADGEDDTVPSAIISRSNRSFRTLLQRHGVTYTMPNSTRPERTTSEPNIDGPPATMDLDNEAALQQRIQQRKEEKMEKDEDLSAASVLLIQGRQGQQGR